MPISDGMYRALKQMKSRDEEAVLRLAAELSEVAFIVCSVENPSYPLQQSMKRRLARVIRGEDPWV